MFALIDTENKVIEVKESRFEVHSDLKWVECPNDCEFGWILQDGQVMAAPVYQHTEQELLFQFNQAIQEFIDSVAKDKQYESSLHCATYANSTNQQWQQEAQTFIAWRDSVWTYAYDILNQVEQEQIPAPTIEEFMAGIPAIVWP